MEMAGCVLTFTDPSCIDEPRILERAASGICTKNVMCRVVQHRAQVVKRSLPSLYVTFSSLYTSPVVCEVYERGNR
jgi:hypothetical protein